MYLQGFGKEPSVYAFGAYLMNDGDKPYLCVPMLLIRAGYQRRQVTLRCPQNKQRFRVILPEQAVGTEHHLRFDFEKLEIL